MKSKHMLLMVLCCLIPLAGFAIVSALRIPLGTVLSAVLILACPLSHLLMMKFMMGGHKGHEEHEGHTQPAPALRDPVAEARAREQV